MVVPFAEPRSTLDRLCQRQPDGPRSGLCPRREPDRQLFGSCHFDIDHALGHRYDGVVRDARPRPASSLRLLPPTYDRWPSSGPSIATPAPLARRIYSQSVSQPGEQRWPPSKPTQRILVIGTQSRSAFFAHPPAETFLRGNPAVWTFRQVESSEACLLGLRGEHCFLIRPTRRNRQRRPIPCYGPALARHPVPPRHVMGTDQSPGSPRRRLGSRSHRSKWVPPWLQAEDYGSP